LLPINSQLKSFHEPFTFRSVCNCGSFLQGIRRWSPISNPAPGSNAPDFNLRGVDDRNYSLKDFADAKILVVVFTCNHCPTAQYYEERIKQIASDYKAKGVAVVAIMPNDPNPSGLMNWAGAIRATRSTK